MSEHECLKVERHGPVGWLINNRPDQLNDGIVARMKVFSVSDATIARGRL